MGFHNVIASGINRTDQRTGGLFEGRLRSSLIEADAYLLACQRSIERSPLRASMVPAPAEYSWSSDRANAQDGTDPVVTPHARYWELAGSDAARLTAYRRLFDDVLSAELLRCLHDCTTGGLVPGSPGLERQVAAMVRRRTWKGSPGRPRKETDVGAQGTLAL